MKKVLSCITIILTSYQTTLSQDIIVQDALDKLQIGIIQFNNGNYDKALTIFNELIKEVEKAEAQDLVPEAYLYRAKSNLQLKSNENLCKDLETAIMFNVTEAFLVAKQNCPSIITAEFESEWNYDIGSKYFWDKDYISAIPYLSKSIELSPNNKLAIEARALSYRETGQLEQSLADYKSIISISGDKQYYTPCGEILFELNRIEDALIALNNALSFDPSDTFALMTRGKCYRVLKKYHEAIEDFDKVIKEFPFEDIYVERAKSYLGLNDKKKACKDLAKVTGDNVTDEVTELLKACSKTN